MGGVIPPADRRALPASVPLSVRWRGGVFSVIAFFRLTISLPPGPVKAFFQQNGRLFFPSRPRGPAGGCGRAPRQGDIFSDFVRHFN